MKPTLLILAAGMGSRYGGLKQIDQVGPSGEAIIDYSIYDAIRAGFQKVSFVIRKNIEKDFREVFDEKLSGRIEVEYIYQELEMVPEGCNYPSERVKPWGTAHAVWVAKNEIREPFVVINADDFYGAGSYAAMASYLAGNNDQDFCMMGYQVDQTLSDHGSVSRGVCESGDSHQLSSVVERTEIVRKDDDIIYIGDQGEPVKLPQDTLVSMNIWGFTPLVFEYIETAFSDFMIKHAGNIKSELYIPTVVNDLIARKIANVKILPASDRWFGVTYKEDKPLAIRNIKEMIDSGVYPPSLWS